MGKYIKTEQLKAIIAELEKNTLNGLVSLDKLDKALLCEDVIQLPRINNIDDIISTVKRVMKTELFEEHLSWRATKADVSKAIMITRPTLDKWINCMIDIGYKPYLNRRSFKRNEHKRINILEMLKFIQRIKEEQEGSKAE